MLPLFDGCEQLDVPGFIRQVPQQELLRLLLFLSFGFHLLREQKLVVVVDPLVQIVVDEP